MERWQITGLLLREVRLYLGITWRDSKLDRRLQQMLCAGMIYLNGKLGVTDSDYITEHYMELTVDMEATLTSGEYSMLQILLFEYVRYARDGAMDLFETNYRHIILAEQNKRAVKANAQSTMAAQ